MLLPRLKAQPNILRACAYLKIALSEMLFKSKKPSDPQARNNRLKHEIIIKISFGIAWHF